MQTGLKLAALHSLAVDFVKTGQPAQMTKDLRAPKRPHFMDCTHVAADKTYVSKKILGQLYDQVERIDFVPQFAARFDERILTAYDVSETMFDDVHEIKKDYDAHIRRIMAQHEITTEFEVWSTFVLQHDRTTNDFKFHEHIGQLSNALKDHFRALCRQKAGGKDFQRLGPFVAAMYKITALEMGEAVEECGRFEDVGGRRKPLRTMKPEKMPLMSFPWLFADILGKIASNTEREADGLTTRKHEAAELRQDMLRSSQLKKDRATTNLMDTNDDLHTTAGVTHRGEVLELFDHSSKSKETENVNIARGGQSPSMIARPLVCSSNDEVQTSQSLSEHDLVDISPLGSFNTNFDDARSLSLSSHNGDLASLGQGSYDGEDENSSDANLEVLRGSFSNAPSESNVVEESEFEDSVSSASGQYVTADVEIRTMTALGAETMNRVVKRDSQQEEKEEGREEEEEMKNHAKEEGNGEQASEDSEDDDEVVVSLSTKNLLLDRLERLGADEKPTLRTAEAKVIDSPVPYGHYDLVRGEAR